jgi:hypothetical protein
MSVISRLLFALLLIATGCLAGILLMTEIGIIPAIRNMPLEQYALYWSALDTQMAARLPAYSGVELLLYVLTIVSMWRLRRLPLFWMVCLCLLINASEIFFTVKHQVPVNRELQRIVASGAVAGNAALGGLREATIQHFALRMTMSGSSFVILCLSALFLRPAAGESVASN